MSLRSGGGGGGGDLCLLTVSRAQEKRDDVCH